MVALAPVADLVAADRLGLSNHATAALLGADVSPEQIRAASPQHLLPIGVSQLVVHGTGDTNVPIEISDAYVAAAVAAGDPVDYHRYGDDVDHFTIIDPTSSVWRAIDEVLAT